MSQSRPRETLLRARRAHGPTDRLPPSRGDEGESEEAAEGESQERQTEFPITIPSHERIRLGHVVLPRTGSGIGRRAPGAAVIRAVTLPVIQAVNPQTRLPGNAPIGIMTNIRSTFVDIDDLFSITSDVVEIFSAYKN